jgi:transcriptional regulator with XRE-family HTH domain
MPLYLVEWRTAFGFTLDQISVRLGKHFTSVQKWEKSRTVVSNLDLERLADIYGVHPACLWFHPQDKKLAERLIAAHAILKKTSENAADRWLAVGEFLEPCKIDVACEEK